MPYREFILLAVVVFEFHGGAFAQISGSVKDAAGTPLADVTVFINKSTISGSSDPAGSFALTGIKPGFSELIAYKNGFQIFRSPIRIQEGHAVRVPIKLLAAAAPEITGEVKVAKDRAIFLRELNQNLIGPRDMSHSKIANEDALQFYSSGDTLKIAADPVTVINPSTGYKIILYRNTGEVQIATIMTSMMFRFDSLKPYNDGQWKEWESAREQIFFGSRRHLLSSLVNGQLAQQGFTLKNENGKTLNPDSLLNAVKVMGYAVARMKGRTKVEFDLDGKSDVRQSWLQASDDLAVNSQGNLLNEKTLQVEGSMNVQGIANMVPINFYPQAAIHIRAELVDINKFFQEKVYVHTDKPYYYPGEVMWYKGYVNYYESTLRDSLSKVMYVELISPAGKMVISKKVRIENGTFRGDITIPENLPSGNYQLRAYTNFMKNFSESNVFRKAVRIFGPTDKADPASGVSSSTSSPGLVIHADKPFYKLRDKITITFQTLDDAAQPLPANLSVAITDALQVIPVREAVSIENNYLFPGTKTPVPKMIAYPVEKGIGFNGQFTNDKGQKGKATVTVLEGGVANMVTIVTSATGAFAESNFQFYDSLVFSFQAKNDGGRPVGKIAILPREIMSVTPIDTLPLMILRTQVKQRAVKYEEPHDVAILQEVAVTAKKIEGSQFIARKYGTPHRMFDGSRFKGTDMLNALMQQIPSLKTFNSNDGIGMARYLTIGHNTQTGLRGNTNPTSEVLIYVNDSYRGGGVVGQSVSAVSALAMLNPALLDHVEVFYAKPPNTMIGVEGGEGMIALYLKPGSIDQKDFQKFTIEGFSRARIFRSPDYSTSHDGQKDFRSTIFWEPDLVLQASPQPAITTFYAGDLPGQYHVVAEGVTAENKPVHGEYYIEIRE